MDGKNTLGRNEFRRMGGRSRLHRVSPDSLLATVQFGNAALSAATHARAALQEQTLHLDRFCGRSFYAVSVCARCALRTTRSTSRDQSH
jgi:hypothetical protein